jgi:hypothetical protein
LNIILLIANLNTLNSLHKSLYGLQLLTNHQRLPNYLLTWKNSLYSILINMHARINTHHQFTFILESALQHTVTQPNNKHIQTVIIQSNINDLSTFTALIHNCTLKQLIKYLTFYLQRLLHFIALYIDICNFTIGSDISILIFKMVK